VQPTEIRKCWTISARNMQGTFAASDPLARMPAVGGGTLRLTEPRMRNMNPCRLCARG